MANRLHDRDCLEKVSMRREEGVGEGRNIYLSSKAG